MEKRKQKPDNFGREVTIKGLVIAVLVILMIIPQIILQEKVREREYRKDAAVAEISSRWSGSQTVCGPVLTIPFAETVKNAEGKPEIILTNHTFTPDIFDVKAVVSPEVRRLGMFEAVLYTTAIQMNGSFAAIDTEALDAGVPDLSRARITMQLSDMRGLSSQLVFKFNGEEYPAETAGSSEGYGRPAAANLEIRPRMETLSGPMTFSSGMDLRGSEGLYFIPIGRTTTVELGGEWSHPSFTGSFSPVHNVGQDRNSDDFTATWTVFHYNRQIPAMWTGDSPSFSDTSFGVELVTGTNDYQQNERAVKYATLFILLTFVVFFFVELLTYRRIHPIQYLLVGAALLIFYTLLLSISEIIGFGWAYLISAVATVGLITAYSATVFKNRKHTALLSLILTFLYVYLYFILQLENYTLLIGSVGLFLILAVIMFVSRKINWYRTDAEFPTL